MVFGCISKNFPENIFWCLEKKKENTNPEKHKPQPRKKSSTTTNPVRWPRRHSRSLPVFGSFKYFYRKGFKSGKRNQNPAKENESTTSDERCNRRAKSDERCDERCNERQATSGTIVDRQARLSDAHRSSIAPLVDRRTMRSSGRSRRSSARCDRSIDRKSVV